MLRCWDNPARNIRFFEYDPDGNRLHEGMVGKRETEYGEMQPMDARVLPNGNVLTGEMTELPSQFMISGRNLVSEAAFTPFRTRLGAPEDIAISVTSGSVLIGGPVQAGAYLAGDIILSMTDSTRTKPVAGGYLNLGPVTAAASTTLGNRHFVVKQNSANFSGYFVDDTGTVSSEISLCEGSGAKLASFGNTAILVYSGTDAATGKTSCFGRVVNLDDSVGEEVQLNDPDDANANSVVDVQVMKNENGSVLDQVLIAWRNQLTMEH